MEQRLLSKTSGVKPFHTRILLFHRFSEIATDLLFPQKLSNAFQPAPCSYWCTLGKGSESQQSWGTPLNNLSVAEITEAACREAELYSDAGIDGLIIENMHDLPYTTTAGPEVYATMTAVCTAVRQTCPTLPIGVQILTAANREALAVALASGLDFIRAEGFVFSHVADEGLLNACAGDLLRYRKQIGAEHIQIFTDIKKKHSSHALTSDVSVAETAKAAEFFLSDGVILTGTATGIQADPEDLREVGRAVRIPVLIGSGVTHENVEHYLEASAMIIGSYFKKGGFWANSVDPERVRKFMGKMHKLRV